MNINQQEKMIKEEWEKIKLNGNLMEFNIKNQ